MPLFDSFRAARWARTLNLLLQAILFLTLFAGLNYLARNHAARFDLTQQRRYSLSPETRGYLRDLPRPVRIIVTLTEDSEDANVRQAFKDMRGLLREYVYETENEENRRIVVEYLDVYQRRREADQLGIDQPDCIVLICGDKRRTVLLGEIYQVEKGEKKAFRGEQAITSAILDVSSPEKKKIYFLSGHGELSPDVVDPVHGAAAVVGATITIRSATDAIKVATLTSAADGTYMLGGISNGSYYVTATAPGYTGDAAPDAVTLSIAMPALPTVNLVLVKL